MKKLILKDIVSNTSSNAEGFVLFTELEKFRTEEKFILEIDNDLVLSSSFLNSSIGAYIEKYGLEDFKSRIKFKGNKAQFNKLAKYLNDYAKLYC